LTVGGNQSLIKRAVGDTNFSEEPENGADAADLSYAERRIYVGVTVA